MVNVIIHFLVRKAKLLFALTSLIVLIMLGFSQLPKIDGRLVGFNASDSYYLETGIKLAAAFGAQNPVQIMLTPDLEGKSSVFLESIDDLQNEFQKLFPTAQIHSLAEGRRLLHLNENQKDNARNVLQKASGIPLLDQLVSKGRKSCQIVVLVPNGVTFDQKTFDQIIFKKRKGIRDFHVMSPYHVEKGIQSALQHDLIIISSVIALLFLAYILFAYQSVKAVVFCVVIIVYSLVPALFLFSVFNVPINLVSVLVFPVVLILSVADSIHLLTGLANTEKDKPIDEKMKSTFKKYFTPSFITSATTAVAFYSFLYNDSPNIQDFGLITALTVLIAFLFTYGSAPFLIQAFKIEPKQNRVIAKLSDGLNIKKRLFSIVLVVLSLVSIAVLPKLKFDTSFDDFFPVKSEVSKEHDMINAAFHSQIGIDLMVRSTSLSSTELQETAVELHGDIERLSDVADVQSFRDQLDFRNSFGAAALFVSFPKKGNPFRTEDGTAYRLNVQLKSGKDLEKVNKGITEIVESFSDEIEVVVYSNGLLFKEINQQVASSLLESLLFSFIFIAIMLFLMTKSLLVTAIGIVVNLIPLSLISLIFYAFGFKINIVTALTAVVCLGIIVDDTIHVLYQKVVLKSDLSELRYGILTTSILLFLGFSTFVLSSFAPSQIFGFICALVFIFTVLTDLTLLLLGLEKIEKKKNP